MRNTIAAAADQSFPAFDPPGSIAVEAFRFPPAIAWRYCGAYGPEVYGRATGSVSKRANSWVESMANLVFLGRPWRSSLLIMDG